jgi:multiple sugar transport system permease protein
MAKTFRKLKQWIVPIIAMAVTAVLLIPIVFMISTSLKTDIEIFQSPPTFFAQNPTFNEYKEVLQNKKYLTFFRNSYIISGSVALVCVLLSLLAGYGFSRYRIRGANYLIIVTLIMQMFPAMAKIVPYFDMFYRIGLYDTFLAVIAAHTSFALPFSLLMMKSFFDSIPMGLEEAAQIDGANKLQALFRVVAPLTLPGIIAVALQAFLWSWNEYLFALVLTRGQSTAPITVGIGFFFGQFVTNWNSIMVVAVFASIPLMIMFIFFQKYLVRGLVSGAIK